jgi:hypothetical protein
VSEDSASHVNAFFEVLATMRVSAPDRDDSVIGPPSTWRPLFFGVVVVVEVEVVVVSGTVVVTKRVVAPTMTVVDGRLGSSPAKGARREVVDEEADRDASCPLLPHFSPDAVKPMTTNNRASTDPTTTKPW